MSRTDIALNAKTKETFRGAGPIADFLLTKFAHHKFNEIFYVEFLSLWIRWSGKMKQIVLYTK